MIKPSEQLVLNRVSRHERKRQGWMRKVEEWIKMYQGDAGYKRTASEAIQDGQEQITLPDPINIVNLSQRLMSGTPHISVMPSEPGNAESEQAAEKQEKFLDSMWKRVGQVQRRHVLNDMVLYSLIMGAPAAEVKWIGDKIPDKVKKKTFPILIRALDPREVGVEDGPLWPSWAYRHYRTTIFDLMQRYPNMKTATAPKLSSIMGKLSKDDGVTEEFEVSVIDYWWRDPLDGTICNCVLVEDCFVEEPWESKYPELPILKGRGDYAPGMGSEYDGLSVLHPQNGSWQYKCRLVSQMATGLLWHFWPAVLVSPGLKGMEVGPGVTTVKSAQDDVTLVQIDPNVPLAETVYNHMEQASQQSAYPEVMYGKAPGDIQAGYGVSLLSDAAKGRIKNFMEGLEILISQVNSIVMGLVENYSVDKNGKSVPVHVWGYDSRDQTKNRVSLERGDIDGNYENEVRLTPVIPSDLMKQQTLGIRLADSDYISRQTLWDQYLDIRVPTDEEARLWRDELLRSDEMRSYRLRKAAQRWKPEEYIRILAANPDTMTLLPPPPEGMQWTPEGELEPAPPMDMQPEMGGMQPEMGGMQPGMGMPMGGGMPPQGMPPQGMPPQGMPPQGMPPQGPQQVQPEMVLTGPDGAGGPVPPMAQGLMTPDMMGVPPQADPMAFAQLQGNPLTPEEELMRLAGQVPPG